MEEGNPRFLASIHDEPTNILQPIAGYEREALLPLEDACRPLEGLIDDLPKYVWISKQNCQHPEDGLTEDESASIHLYTMEWPNTEQSLYVNLNRALRGVNRQELKPWFRYLKLFLTALFKLPAVEGMVWRGVHGDLSSQYKSNRDQAWWALSSCTLSLKILESPLYLGRTGTRTLFSIETQSGRRIRSHSHFKHEEEILLLPGTFVEVLSDLSPAENLHIIHLREKSAPFHLLQPPFVGAERRGSNREKLRSEAKTRRRRTINFDDLEEHLTSKHELGDIPDGYANLRWHNVSYMHIDHGLHHLKCQGTGYREVFRRTQHSSYLALNSCGKSMILRSLADDPQETFTVHQLELQAASEDGLQIRLVGFKSNVKLFKKKVQLWTKNSTCVELDWNKIDLFTVESATDEDDDQQTQRFHVIVVSLQIT